MILTCPNCATSFHVAPDTFGPGRRKVRCSRCRHIWQQDPLPEPEPEPPPPPPAPPPEEEFPIPPRKLVVEPDPEPMPPPPVAPMAAPPISDEPVSRVMNIELDDDALDGIDRPPLHPPFDGPAEAGEEDPDAVLAQRRERLARAGVQRPPSKPRKKRSYAWIGWLLLFGLLGGVIGGGYQKRNELIAFYPPLAKLYEQLGIPVDAADWLGLELHNLKSSTIIEGGQTKIAVSGEVVNVGKRVHTVPAIRVAMRGAGNKELNAYTLTLQQPSVAAGEKLTFDVKLPAPKDEVTDLEVAFASQTPVGEGPRPTSQAAPAAPKESASEAAPAAHGESATPTAPAAESTTPVPPPAPASTAPPAAAPATNQSGGGSPGEAAPKH
ncbi:zinc-ribbon domain-containing protein [Ferrovibrio xuzhouensis]|uniref:Zinc-ribbon domain-containing protein n=1 Tax=Ferrovibrio xuzhouensis TaxID=1576914 RepID=A0ABV7VC22_9PROT